MEWLEKLNEFRMESGMSLDEISEKSGVPKGTLSKITAGITKSPSIETIKSIVHVMGHTLDDLYESKKAPAPGEPSTEALSPEQLRLMLVYYGIIEDGQDLTEADAKFLACVAVSLKHWFNSRQ